MNTITPLGLLSIIFLTSFIVIFIYYFIKHSYEDFLAKRKFNKLLDVTERELDIKYAQAGWFFDGKHFRKIEL